MTALVAAGKRAHERLMTDVCTITRNSVGGFNDATGQRATSLPYDAAVVYNTDNLYWNLIYSGKCRIKFAPVVQTTAGERRNAVSVPLLVLPAGDVSAILERDIVTMSSSLNPSLIAVTFSVIGEEMASTSTSRRFEIERRA